MKNVLILGGNGRIAQFAIQDLLTTNNKVTLLVRDARKVSPDLKDRVSIIVGDVTELPLLTAAMKDIDIVYSNLGSRNIVPLAKNVITAIKLTSVQHLVWVSTLGIYNELPTKFNEFNHQALGNGGEQSYLSTYTKAANLIENSGLNYTIIRPAWLSDNNDLDYELTERNETFKGTVVSRRSVGVLIAKIINQPEIYRERSIGVNKPNTDGDEPLKY